MGRSSSPIKPKQPGYFSLLTLGCKINLNHPFIPQKKTSGLNFHPQETGSLEPRIMVCLGNIPKWVSTAGPNLNKPNSGFSIYTQMLNVWRIYLHLAIFYGKCRYTIDWASGIYSMFDLLCSGALATLKVSRYVLFLGYLPPCSLNACFRGDPLSPGSGHVFVAIEGLKHEKLWGHAWFWHVLGESSLQREKGSTPYIVGSKILAAKWVFWGMFFLRCKKMLSPNFLKQSKKNPHRLGGSSKRFTNSSRAVHWDPLEAWLYGSL